MAHGSMIYSMDLAKKLGKTAQLDLKASTFKVKKLVEDDMSGRMEVFTKATSWIACSMDMVFTILLNLRKRMRDSLPKINLRAKAS